MILTEDVLNSIRKSVLNTEKMQIENFNSFVDFKGETLEQLCAFLPFLENVQAKLENGKMQVEVKPKIVEIDDYMKKRANASVWNYEQRRKLYDPEYEMLEKFLNLDEEKEKEVSYKKLEKSKYKIIEKAKQFLDSKFEIDDNECYLMLVNEFTYVDVSAEFLRKLAFVIRRFDFLFIVPIFDEETDELKYVRVLTGYDKAIK